MKVVGITGGIGSGKSTVCKIFELLGVPIFYSDDEAKKLYDDKKVVAKVCELFGKKVLDKNGKVDKKKLAEIVFSNNESLGKINALIHPLVRKKFEAWKKQNSSSKYVIKEAAILIESGIYKELDFLISVRAPKSLVVNRISKYKKINKIDLKNRISSQISDKEREKYSDAIIVNDGSHSLIEQVLQIDHRLRKK
ncbi:MAG TPA: dephospho-CoA kinase [Bacteroidia bacterium]